MPTWFAVISSLKRFAMAGQGDAQNQSSDDTPMFRSAARDKRRAAVIQNLLKTWDKCTEQVSGRSGERSWCDVYDKQVSQMPFDDVALSGPMSSERVWALKAKLTTEELELIKRAIAQAAVDGHRYGKKKGAGAK